MITIPTHIICVVPNSGHRRAVRRAGTHKVSRLEILDGLDYVLKTIPKISGIFLGSSCYLQVDNSFKLGLYLREIMMWLQLTDQNTPPRSLIEARLIVVGNRIAPVSPHRSPRVR